MFHICQASRDGYFFFILSLLNFKVTISIHNLLCIFITMANENVVVDDQIENTAKININESEINDRVQKIIHKANSINNEITLTLLSNAILYIDLTSLKGDETIEEIQQLCAKASNVSVIDSILTNPISTAAVCVFPTNACDAIQALRDLNARDRVKVVSVAADFPAAKLPLQTRIEEVELVVEYDVDEVDIVINRKLALEHKWKELYEELRLIRKAIGNKIMKTILATGDLPNLSDVYTASVVAMLAGSDFIKTSTGKEAVNATLPVGVVMCKAIKDYHATTKQKIGLKPAGGIKTSKDVLQWMTLISEELGNEWLTKDLFRIGASSVLENIVKTINTLK